MGSGFGYAWCLVLGADLADGGGFPAACAAESVEGGGDPATDQQAVFISAESRAPVEHTSVVNEQGLAGGESQRKARSRLEGLDEFSEGRRGLPVRHPRREVDPVGAILVLTENRIGARVVGEDHVGTD